MSNIIPFVSSSPPPIDGDKTFGWEEDDNDDFGNFASAPTAFDSSTTQDDSWKGGGFEAVWPSASDASAAFVSIDAQGSSEKFEKQNEETEQVSVSKSSSKDRGEQDEVQVDGNSGDDDFADFEAFQGETGESDTPHIDSLPLKSTLDQQSLDEEGDTSDTVAGRGADTAMEKSRDSTTTDSGLFSNDMSPLPQSESQCISEGEKTLHSDDETFSDIPQDARSQVLSPSGQDQGIGDTDPSEEDDPQSVCEDSLTSSEKEPSRQSDITLSPDHTEKQISVLSGMSEITECEASDEMDEKDIANGMKPNDCFRSSPAEESEHVDCLDPKEASSTPDLEKGIKDNNVELDGRSANNDGAIEVEVKDNQQSDLDMSASETVDPGKTPETTHSSHGCSEDDNEEDVDDDDDWAAFETPAPFHPQSSNNTVSQQEDPDDLVLRKDSIHFDSDENELSGASNDDCNIGEKSADNMGDEEEVKTDSAMSKEEDGRCNVDTPENRSDTHSLDGVDKEAGSQLEHSVFADHPPESSDSPSLLSAVNDLAVRSEEENDDDFGDFRGDAFPAQSDPPSEDNTVADSNDKEDFARFPAAEASYGDSGEDFGNFSSNQGADLDDDVDEDDFGDFNSGGAADSKADKDKFGAFSDTPAGHAAGEDDDFGGFSGQPAASADSGWADFAEPAKTSMPDEDDDEDFGNFSASEKPAQSGPVSDVNYAPSDHASFPSSGSETSSLPQNARTKLETSLKSCFPSSDIDQQQKSDGQGEATQGKGQEEEELSGGVSGDGGQRGVLETILEYGLQFRSASQQTWQVVQHPSRKDPRVKLWVQLQDMDGSPAVLYHWSKSCTNSRLFHTLHIDTQNMLIGHKKPSVPIFATGLSLLEPIRGGKKGREAGGILQPDQGPMSSILSPALVDSTAQESQQRTQDIPAVDFDWSSSGLTNPLTSHSLDLDFLVVQDSQALDKPSVFQSELLDAPRSGMKPSPSSHPLEDILKSVKPTSVRSARQQDAAASQMSPEALRVLASLPDLSFMQSKVLMFPIRN